MRTRLSPFTNGDSNKGMSCSGNGAGAPQMLCQTSQNNVGEMSFRQVVSAQYGKTDASRCAVYHCAAFPSGNPIYPQGRRDSLGASYLFRRAPHGVSHQNLDGRQPIGNGCFPLSDLSQFYYTTVSDFVKILFLFFTNFFCDGMQGVRNTHKCPKQRQHGEQNEKRENHAGSPSRGVQGQIGALRPSL